MKEIYSEEFNSKLTVYIWMSWNLKYTTGTRELVPLLLTSETEQWRITNIYIYFFSPIMEMYCTFDSNDYTI